MRQEGTLPELQELAEQIGEFIHYWGFKRVHGRIWTSLFLAKKPLDAADLVNQLSISKALVSISLRELLEFDVIQEVGKSPRGTHLYRTNPDILSVILSVLRQREKRMLSRIEAAHEALSRVNSEEREKYGLSEKHTVQLGSLVGKAVGALEGIIALQGIDFGDWRKDFLTVDLEEENELRKNSVVAPPSKERSPVHFAPSEIEDDEPSRMETAPTLPTPPATDARTASMEPEILLPGVRLKF